MIIKNFKYENEIANITYYISLIITLWGIGNSLLISLIVNSGYFINKVVFIRLILFFVIISFSPFYKLLKPYGMIELFGNNLKLLFLVSIISISFSLGSIYLTIDSYESNNIIYIVFIIHLLVFGWGAWNKHIPPNIKIGNFGNYITFIFVIAAIIIPLAAPKFLNSESYLNFKEIYTLKKPKTNSSDGKNGWLSIEFNEVDSKIIRKNIIYAERKFNKLGIGYYEIVDDGKSINFSFDVLSDNKTPACLLVEYKTDLINNLKRCIINFNSLTKKKNITNGIDNLLSTEYLNDQKIKSLLIEYIDRANAKKIIENQNFRQIDPLLSLMLVRGAILHHYNAVLKTLYLANSPLDYFGNQYGFGSLLIIKGISYLFDFKLLDALFISISLISIILLFITTILIRKFKYKNIILMGFSLSILVTFAISNIIAPMLYFIRYLPLIFIGLYLFYKEKTDNREIGVLDNIFFISLVLVNSLYSFEYGLILCGAIFVVGVLHKNFLYILISLASTSLIFLFKIFIIQKNIFEGMSIVVSIAGVGMDGRIGLISYLYIICILCLTYMMYRIKSEFKTSKELDLLFYIYICLSFKLIWTGAGNHIGAIFMFSSMLISLILVKYENLIIKNKNISNLYFYSTSLIILISCILLTQRQLMPSNEFENIKYNYSTISDIFKLSESMNEKGNSFIQLKNKDDLLLSKNDDFLELFSQTLSTKPYQNISTNINYKVDEDRIINIYIDSKAVIIDKSIINKDEISYVAKNYLGLNQLTDNFIYNYIAEDRKFYRIYVELLKHKFVKCGENIHFIKLCKI